MYSFPLILSLPIVNYTNMLKFLSILFVILFVVPFLLRAILKFLFGSRPVQQNRSSQQRNTSSRTQQQQQSSAKKKVISENEGEYVDYEEIKD